MTLKGPGLTLGPFAQGNPAPDTEEKQNESMLPIKPC